MKIPGKAAKINPTTRDQASIRWPLHALFFARAEYLPTLYFVGRSAQLIALQLQMRSDPRPEK
jgi:hypothetical protein